MSRRTPRGPLQPRMRPRGQRTRLDSRPWVMRVIVVLAIAIVITGIVVAALTGVLFTAPVRH